VREMNLLKEVLKQNIVLQHGNETKDLVICQLFSARIFDKKIVKDN
jgi:hypothetical protein